jgi:hypothetical protein
LFAAAVSLVWFTIVSKTLMLSAPGSQFLIKSQVLFMKFNDVSQQISFLFLGLNCSLKFGDLDGVAGG